MCKIALSEVSRFCNGTSPWRHVEDERHCSKNLLEVSDKFHAPAAVPVDK